MRGFLRDSLAEYLFIFVIYKTDSRFITLCNIPFLFYFIFFFNLKLCSLLPHKVDDHLLLERRTSQSAAHDL